MIKTRLLFAVVASSLSVTSFAQEAVITNTLPLQNTYPISPTDSQSKIIEKASHVVPTLQQYEAMKNEFIAFIHFGPNTFTRMEWGLVRKTRQFSI